MKPQTNPQVDYAFKHVFGREESKPVLMNLLDAVLQPARDQTIASVELLTPFNEQEALDDKQSVLDIAARDATGRQFNVEMQMVAYAAFQPRLLYYWSRLYQRQLRKGDDYRFLRPTIAICFVGTPLFAEWPDYHSMFELRERRHQTLFTDHLTLHILELRKFCKAIEQLATPLDRWLFFLQHAEDLDADALPEPLNVPEVRWAPGDLTMISQDERQRALHESRRKMQLDTATAMAVSRDEGRVEGRIEGRAEERIERIQSLERWLRRDATPVEQLQRLSLAEMEALVARLEADLNQKLGSGASL